MLWSEDIPVFRKWGNFNWPWHIQSAVCVYHSPQSDRNTKDVCVHVSAAHSPCVGWGHMLHEAPVDTHMDSHEDICTWRTPMKWGKSPRKQSKKPGSLLLNMSANTAINVYIVHKIIIINTFCTIINIVVCLYHCTEPLKCWTTLVCLEGLLGCFRDKDLTGV